VSLIRHLASQRTPSGPPVISRYQPEEAVSYVLEDGAWVPSWKSSNPPRTKKADLETGEDQKGQ
jgi:hypothetical protein